jgi:hypothetical protein
MSPINLFDGVDHSSTLYLFTPFHLNDILLEIQHDHHLIYLYLLEHCWKRIFLSIVTNKAKKLLVMQKFKNNHLEERPNVIVRYKVDEWSTPSNKSGLIYWSLILCIYCSMFLLILQSYGNREITVFFFVRLQSRDDKYTFIMFYNMSMVNR